MSDIPIDNPTGPPRVSHRRPGSNGFYEQWQRALERAYFDRQAELMRGAPAEKTALEPVAQGQNRKPGPLPDPVAAAEFVAGGNEPGQRHGGAGTTGPALPAVTVTPRVDSAPVVRADDHAGSALTGKVEAGAMRSMASSARLKPVSVKGVHGVLPSTSVVTVIHTGQGAQLFVRDATLHREDVSRLVTRLRGAMEAVKQPLLSITLNGESVWNRRS